MLVMWSNWPYGWQTVTGWFCVRRCRGGEWKGRGRWVGVPTDQEGCEWRAGGFVQYSVSSI
jgi:hypothetical protein